LRDTIKRAEKTVGQNVKVISSVIGSRVSVGVPAMNLDVSTIFRFSRELFGSHKKHMFRKMGYISQPRDGNVPSPETPWGSLQFPVSTLNATPALTIPGSLTIYAFNPFPRINFDVLIF